MTAIRTLPLSEVTKYIRNGKSIKQSKQAGGLPISRIETIANQEIDMSKTGRADISHEIAGNYILQHEDILFSHINSTTHIGKTALYDQKHGKLVHGMNLLCLHPDPNKILPKYLLYALRSHQFKSQLPKVTKPSVNQASVSIEDLKKLIIPVPPIEKQRRIAAILDKADSIRRKREQALALADDFLRSTFIEMFGDPALNPKGWEMAPIRDFGLVTTGNTPSRKISQYYGDAIEWIKSDNINTPHNNLTAAKEWLSEKGREVGRVAPTGSVLVTCIAGSFDCIGNAAISDREVAFNQQINAISPAHNLDTEYLYMHLVVGKKLIQNASTNSMKGMVSKGKFQDINLMKPPKKARIEYSRAFRSLVKCRDNMSRNHLLSDDMFASVSQRAFRGEL